MEHINPPTGADLRAFRAKHDLTQSELSRELGMDNPSTISQWEYERRKPPIFLWLALEAIEHRLAKGPKFKEPLPLPDAQILFVQILMETILLNRRRADSKPLPGEIIGSGGVETPEMREQMTKRILDGEFDNYLPQKRGRPKKKEKPASK